jgi:RNA polymerase subunit RPABC4/transcription elongation factor Spt4
LRPPQTLAEQYEQSLEEEALLQEIEDRRVCPGCSRQVLEDWQLCPNCLTRLKKTCENCGKLLDLPWTVCPYCTHVVARGPEPEAPGPDQLTTAEPEAATETPA